MTNVYLALEQDMDSSYVIGAFSSLIASKNAIMDYIRKEIKQVKDVYTKEDLEKYQMTWAEIVENRGHYIIQEIEVDSISQVSHTWKLDYELDSDCKIKKFDWVSL